jgi:hypothetical protein
MAENATLIIALSGEHRSKKEVAYTLVPAIGRRVLDLGGNVEKGETLSVCDLVFSYLLKNPYRTSADLQTHRQLSGSWLYRADCGGLHDRRKDRNWSRARLRIYQRYGLG